ncbi:MAG: MFS transporter [Anaerolineales bacterium]|jgi:MFS family permease
MDPTIQAEIDKNYKFNFTVNVIDGTLFWFGASFFATRTIAPLFLSYLTDNTLVFGILATIASTGWLLPQMFTANWVQQRPIKKYLPVNIGLFTERLPIILLPLAAWAALKSHTLAIFLFIFLLAWHILGAGVIAVGWQDMLAKIFPVEKRGRFFGTANFSGNATGILGASAAAWVLEYFDFPYNFMVLFGIAGVFIFLSWISLAMTREPAVPPKKERLTNKLYWRSLPQIIRTDENFRRFLYSQIVLTAGGMGMGFFTIYALRQWSISDGMVGLFTTSLMVGTALSNLIFGWMADKFGHKLVIELSTLALMLSSAIALLAPTPEYFYLVFALQGVYTAGIILSGIMIVFEFCEEDIRPTYIGLTNSSIGIFAGITPMIGGWLADTAGFAWLFGVSAIFSILSFILLRFTVGEPRKTNLLIE